MMEQAGESGSDSPPGGNEAVGPLNVGGAQSKRLKQLENAALQTTLTSRMETESNAEANGWAEQQCGDGKHPNGLSVNHQPAASRRNPDDDNNDDGGGGREEEESNRDAVKERAEEGRTLTDHLNKRLLSSFLEKLNERDLALPGVQRLDCDVAEEDSNRAADEW